LEYHLGLPYNNAEVTHTSLPAGAPTINAPKNIFNLWTTYDIRRGFARSLGFGIGGRHYTDQSATWPTASSSLVTGIVDASVTYRRGLTRWQLNANNLDKKRHRADSYNDVYVKAGEPRVIRGTVSWNFQGSAMLNTHFPSPTEALVAQGSLRGSSLVGRSAFALHHRHRSHRIHPRLSERDPPRLDAVGEP
jgi:hypothetical protein